MSDVSLFVGQSFFKFRFETFQDLNNAQWARIYFRKHDGTTGFWTGVIDDGAVSNSQITYETQNGDLDQNGWWEFQGKALMPDGRYVVGEKTIQEVKPSIT